MSNPSALYKIHALNTTIKSQIKATATHPIIQTAITSLEDFASIFFDHSAEFSMQIAAYDQLLLPHVAQNSKNSLSIWLLCDLAWLCPQLIAHNITNNTHNTSQNQQNKQSPSNMHLFTFFGKNTMHELKSAFMHADLQTQRQTCQRIGNLHSHSEIQQILQQVGLRNFHTHSETITLQSSSILKLCLSLQQIPSVNKLLNLQKLRSTDCSAKNAANALSENDFWKYADQFLVDQFPADNDKASANNAKVAATSIDIITLSANF